MDEGRLTQFRRKQVGFIFQSFGLNPLFSAYENVDIMLRIGGASNRVCHERTTACLKLVGLKLVQTDRALAEHRAGLDARAYAFVLLE